MKPFAISVGNTQSGTRIIVQTFLTLAAADKALPAYATFNTPRILEYDATTKRYKKYERVHNV